VFDQPKEGAGFFEEMEGGRVLPLAAQDHGHLYQRPADFLLVAFALGFTEFLTEILEGFFGV
jgi:hypothetical protein